MVRLKPNFFEIASSSAWYAASMVAFGESRLAVAVTYAAVAVEYGLTDIARHVIGLLATSFMVFKKRGCNMRVD
jgi:hypothetical protein